MLRRPNIRPAADPAVRPRLGRLGEAVEAWADMLGRNGSNDLLTADTMLSRGRALVALGRRDEDRTAFDDLIRHCRKQSRYLTVTTT